MVDTLENPAQYECPNNPVTTAASAVGPITNKATVNPEAAAPGLQKGFPPVRDEYARSHQSIWETHQQLMSIGEDDNASRPRNHRYSAGVLTLRDI